MHWPEIEPGSPAWKAEQKYGGVVCRELKSGNVHSHLAVLVLHVRENLVGLNRDGVSCSSISSVHVPIKIFSQVSDCFRSSSGGCNC